MTRATTTNTCQSAPSELDLASARDAGQKAARLGIENPADYAEYPYGSRIGATFLQAYQSAKAEIEAWRATKGI